MGMMIMDAGLVHALKVRLVDHRGVGAGVADHEVVQVSTIAAVLDRKYDGDVTIGEILASGDQGLGTLNGLDGEIIIVDGEAWQGGADGVVRRVGEEEKTPFAVSTRFRADAEVELGGSLEYGELVRLMEGLGSGVEGCDAVRVDGEFPWMHLRSVWKQERPYRSLGEVAAEQVEWRYENLRGTMVGFRFPQVAESVEMVGYHLHFISEDRQIAGHVLRCGAGPGRLRVERMGSMRLELPPGVELPGRGERPREEDLRRIEGG